MSIRRIFLAIARIVAVVAIAGLAPAMLASWAYAQQSQPLIKRPPPPALWVVNKNSPSIITVFQGVRLTRKTGPIGGFSITASSVSAGGLTFDSSMDLWVGLCDLTAPYDGYLVEETPAGLRRLYLYGTAKFNAVISDPLAPSGGPEYLSCPRALQFDPSGNLWVQVRPTNDTPTPSLIEYARGLLVSGNPVPTAQIQTTNLGTGSGAVAMAFDHAGNLWEAADGIVEYTAAQLAAGTQTDPYQTLIVGGGTPDFSYPSAVTFDASGNLWVAFEIDGGLSTGGLEMIAAADLAGSGTSTPTPAVVLTSTAYGKGNLLTSFQSPDGLAFDSLGNLWVANTLQPKTGLGSGSLVEFGVSELTTSGSPVPLRGILANHYDSNMMNPGYLTFGPSLP
ncbi:MAG TPA: hypothetical protein VND20_00335 [Candidatus Binataceae bacterium]|nr:hypothetical protein [Candidatus Binataceae bacterium]